MLAEVLDRKMKNTDIRDREEEIDIDIMSMKVKRLNWFVQLLIIIEA